MFGFSPHRVILLRMKRWGWMTAIVVVALGGLSVWFWSLAAVPTEEPGAVILHVDHAPVEVRASAQASFKEATDGMVLSPGATIKTGEGGKATVELFGQAETRMDASSELTITEAVASSEPGTVPLQIRLTLGAGRVWSRVLKLLDLDSSFQVGASSVVATVRGTAFDVRLNADGTSEVWVSESAVSVNPAGAQQGDDPLPAEDGTFKTVTSTPALAVGESALYGKDGKPVWRKPITAEDRASHWFTDNTVADGVFVSTARDQLRDQLNALNGNEGPFSALSERMHLVLAKGEAKREVLLRQYLVRRIARIIRVAESGKSGLAAQEFSRLENDLKDRLKGEHAVAERRRLLVALARVDLLVQDAQPGTALYPLKQRLEDLATEARQSQGPAEGVFARLLAVDTRLGEAERFLNDGNYKDAETALDAARSGIANTRRDIPGVLKDLAAIKQHALRGKMLALSVREAAARNRLRIALHPEPIPASTSTTELVATSTPAATTPKPSTPVVTPPAPSAYTGISASIQPNPVSLNATANLYVLATKTDGTGTADVTSRSTFKVVQGSGTLSGSRFTATTAGTVAVEASFVDQGKTFTSRATLTVSGGLASLDTLIVSASSGAPKPGERVTLTAMANYTNGFKKEVSGNATWKNLSPALGSIAGNVFTPVTTASGQAELQATYTEDGVTKMASVYVTVTASATSTRTAPNN